MHLGGLLSTQEARNALDVTFTFFFVLGNLSRASITRWLHATREPFLDDSGYFYFHIESCSTEFNLCFGDHSLLKTLSDYYYKSLPS